MVAEGFQRTIPASAAAVLVAFIVWITMHIVGKLVFLLLASSSELMYAALAFIVPISIGMVVSLRITKRFFGKANMKQVFYTIFCAICFHQLVIIATSIPPYLVGALFVIATAYIAGKIVLGQIQPESDYPRDNPFERHLNKNQPD